jgi:hypothetical protein
MTLLIVFFTGVGVGAFYNAAVLPVVTKIVEAVRGWLAK